MRQGALPGVVGSSIGKVPDLQKTANRVELLRQMLLSRYFDEKVNDLYAEGKVHGTAHFYVGQESVAVGAISALKEGDVITSTQIFTSKSS